MFQAKLQMGSWRIHAKNVRINTDIRLVELLSSLVLIHCDVVCFSETRCKSQDRALSQ